MPSHNIPPSTFLLPPPFPTTTATTTTTTTTTTVTPRRRTRLQNPPLLSVQRVHNPTDFAAAMPPNPSAALVVFSFITRNCRACLYASHAYSRLAADLADKVAVRFCEMDVSERQNHRLCRELGVEAVPTFQFYKFVREGNGESGVGVLDEVVGPRQVGRVRQRVLEIVDEGFDSDDYVFENTG